MFAWVVRDRFLLHLLLGGEGRDEGEQLFAPLSAVALGKGEKAPP